MLPCRFGAWIVKARLPQLAVTGGLQIVVLSLAIFFTTKSFFFLTDNQVPAGYFYDLGVNILATSYESATVHSVREVLDALGWAYWADHPQFFYNPMMTSVILVPMAKIVHSALLAVKLAIVLQFVLAVFGMWFLARKFRLGPAWSLLAAFIYALLPSTALAICSNLDVGFTLALLPLLLAINRELVCTFGVNAFPLAGCLSGFLGSCFNTEYIFFCSFPVYIFTVLSTAEGIPSFRKFLVIVLGMLNVVAVDAYCILSTISGHQLFAEPASRIAEVSSGDITKIFGEDVESLTYLLIHETILNPDLQFNARQAIPYVNIMGLLLLSGCAYRLVTGLRKLPRFHIIPKNAILFIGGLVALSFGYNLQPVGFLWYVARNVPYVQFIRTPDRFMYVPICLIALLGVAGLEHLARLKGRSGKVISLIIVGLVSTSACLSDLKLNVMLGRPSVEERFPNLPEVMTLVRERAPVLDLSFPKDGSVFQTSLYGYGLPSRLVGFDLFAKFGFNSESVSGVLRRAGIGSIIITPPWASGFPTSLSPIVKADNDQGLRQVGFKSGPRVYFIRHPIPVISQVSTTCVLGSYGRLYADLASVEPMTLSFVRHSNRCGDSLLLNFDPRDEGLGSAISRWTATDLIPTGSPLRDADYPFVWGRALLADPSYRNTVDGYRPLFGPFVRAIPSKSGILRNLGFISRGTYSFCVRGLFPSKTMIDVAIGNVHGRLLAESKLGLRWFEIPLKIKNYGEASISIRFTTLPNKRRLPRVSYIDGAALFKGSVISRRNLGTIASVAFDISPGVQNNCCSTAWVPSGLYRVIQYGPHLRVVHQSTKNISRSQYAVFGIERGTRWVLLKPVYRTANLESEGKIRVSRESALSFLVRLERRGTVRLTYLNDLNWTANGGVVSFSGYSCDIVDTCFDLPRGVYRLKHGIPRSTRTGIFIGWTAWLCSILFLTRFARKAGPS